MNPIAFDLTAENGTLYPDEVTVVNTYRRLKRGLSTGYGEVHFSVEVVDHCGRSITTVFEERAIVDEDAPTMVGAIYRITSKAT